jgi:hypothetical protein
MCPGFLGSAQAVAGVAIVLVVVSSTAEAAITAAAPRRRRCAGRHASRDVMWVSFRRQSAGISGQRSEMTGSVGVSSATSFVGLHRRQRVGAPR